MNEALRAGESRSAGVALPFLLPSPIARGTIPPIDNQSNDRRYCHDSLATTDDRRHATARPLAPYPTRLPPSHPTLLSVLWQAARSNHRRRTAPLCPLSPH